MESLRFKQLTVDNYQQPDPVLTAFVRMSEKDGSTRTLTGEDWAEKILAVELSEQVPLEVRRLFAVARGALLYGYFFYPLYTLGAEQLFRVAESAVGHKCRNLGVPAKKLEDMTFQKRLSHLVDEGVIPASDHRRWDALRHLRNLTSHPKDQTILLPHTAIGELQMIATGIDAMYRGRP
jgi:hypothetical protein